MLTLPAPAALPPGLTIDSLGNVSGIPYLPGDYTFPVAVSDAAGNSAYKTYSFQVGTPAPFLMALPSALVGKQYAASILMSPAPAGPYTWTFNGQTPPGFTLEPDGTFHGLAMGEGEYTFTVTGVAANGETGAITENFDVGPNPALAEGLLPDATVGQPYSAQLSSSLTGTVQWIVNNASLPAGIAFNASTGTLTGTPATAGEWGLTATATRGE